ncbi:MAG: glycine--tRNA ligase subunit beta, partial [Actinomycetota bacterium]|nr:glycine--tRNA ligase subunit beta [Actinomycetota bacterium]
VSHAVVEFPALQGVMGRYYALAQGETEQVATAIFEHYRPRFAGDELPSTTAGMLVSAADKLDTMVGIFAIGQGPTGSADPYALRRGAIGVLSMILDGELALDDMAEAIGAALETYPDAVLTADRNAVGRQVAAFLRTRLAVMLKDRGLAYDTVEALLALSTDRFAPADILARGVALQGARDNDPVLFADLSSAFTRAKNLADFSLGTESDPALMGGAEAALADALSAAEQAAAASFEVAEYSSVVGVLASLRGPIDAFFDGVMVMDKDDQLRANRLKLLNRFVALFVRFADLSKISE